MFCTNCLQSQICSNQIFNKQNILMNIIALVIFLLIRRTVLGQVINGDFQRPAIKWLFQDAFQYPYFLAEMWDGKYQIIANSLYSSTSGQLIDTVVSSYNSTIGANLNEAGYLSQQILIFNSGIYNLSFQYSAQPPNNISVLYLDVIWNGNIISTVNPAVISVIYHFNINITAYQGVNILKFNLSSFDPRHYYGVFLDNVQISLLELFSTSNLIPQLNQTNITITIHNQSILHYFIQKIVSSISNVMVLPRGIIVISQVMFMIDDLRLYNYDKVQYQGFVQQIFDTQKQIVSLQWCLLNLILAFKARPQFATSNYTAFTTTKFLQIQENDFIFMNNIIWFLILTIPQTILLYLIFNIIFHFTQTHFLSKYIRRYCFLASIFQVLFEGNMGYFSFLFFSQSKMNFYFTYTDKYVNSASVALFGFAFLITLAYFVVMDFLYSQRSGYFIYYFYRTNHAIAYLSFKVVARSIIQGAAHALFQQNYNGIIFVLTIIQVVVLIWTVVSEISAKIFLRRSQWIFCVIYHFAFVLFNLSLLFFQMSEGEQKLLVQSCQKTLILIIISTTIAIVICDFLPNKPSQSKKYKQCRRILTDSEVRIANSHFSLISYIPELNQKQRRARKISFLSLIKKAKTHFKL